VAADRRLVPPRTVVSVIGTRPEAIKMRPVLAAISAAGGIEQRLILTGQHRGLRDGFDFIAERSVRQLGINTAEQSPGEMSGAVRDMLCRVLDRRGADLVLVHGDTASAYGAALAARECGIPLGHVEAGLRSFDRLHPWPEEGYRVAIDALSDLLFAPSEAAVANLAREPQVRGAVHLTGNSGIDALLEAQASLPPLAAQEDGRKRILLTCHRRENRGEPLRKVAAACRHLAAELPVRFIVPLHPSPPIRRAMRRLLGATPHINLVEPLEYPAMIATMMESWAILTDSGGLQEEAPALGRPVFVLRDVTERPEVIEGGSAELVGTETDRIVAAVRRLHDDPAHHARMSTPAFPYGRGDAGSRIAAVVQAFLERPAAERRLASALPVPAVLA
jgi:UDP-N-acetylglucosamine 2-epimerase (non-hydrolysing)